MFNRKASTDSLTAKNVYTRHLSDWAISKFEAEIQKDLNLILYPNYTSDTFPNSINFRQSRVDEFVDAADRLQKTFDLMAPLKNKIIKLGKWAP